MRLFEAKVQRLKEAGINKNRLNTLMLAIDDAIGARASLDAIYEKGKFETKDTIPYRSTIHQKVKVIKKFIKEFGGETIISSLPEQYQKGLNDLNKHYYIF